MFCPKCGARVPDGASTCPACGAAMKSSAAVSADGFAHPAGTTYRRRPASSRTFSRIVAALAIVALAAGVCLFAQTLLLERKLATEAEDGITDSLVKYGWVNLEHFDTSTGETDYTLYFFKASTAAASDEIDEVEDDYEDLFSWYDEVRAVPCTGIMANGFVITYFESYAILGLEDEDDDDWEFITYQMDTSISIPLAGAGAYDYAYQYEEDGIAYSEISTNSSGVTVEDGLYCSTVSGKLKYNSWYGSDLVTFSQAFVFSSTGSSGWVATSLVEIQDIESDWDFANTGLAITLGTNYNAPVNVTFTITDVAYTGQDDDTQGAAFDIAIEYHIASAYTDETDTDRYLEIDVSGSATGTLTRGSGIEDASFTFRAEDGDGDVIISGLTTNEEAIQITITTSIPWTSTGKVVSGSTDITADDL